MFGAHAHRSRRRHDRYLAAVSVSRRRLDHQRRHQPARARRSDPRADGAIETSARSTPAGSVARAHWSEIPSGDGLSLLALLARHYRLENATLTTRGESPRRRRHRGVVRAGHRRLRRAGPLDEAVPPRPSDLLQVAMNVECQAIRVPTGVQDYRPALYGGIAAIELGVDGIRRVALDVDPASWSGGSSWPTPGPRGTPGTNNWEITKRHLDGDRQHLRLLRAHPRHCGGDAGGAAGRRLGRGGPPDRGEWENRKRLARRRHDARRSRRLIARATAAGADSGQGLRRRRRWVPVLLRPAARAGLDCAPRSPRRRAGARLPYRDGRPAAWITQAIARILKEIADLLEIRNDNPFKIRAYRNGADIAGNHPHALATLDAAGAARDSRHREGSRVENPRDRRDRRSGYHRELVAEFPPSILDLLHLQGVGPKTVATLYRELGVRTLEDLERAAAEGRIRALRGMGARRKR